MTLPEEIKEEAKKRSWKQALAEYKHEPTKQKKKKGSGEDSEGNEDTKPNAELLMDLAAQHIELLFKDQNGFAHAAIRIRDHREILPVETSRFKRYLAKLFWDEYHKTIGADAINNATTILQAKAEYESETYPLTLRVASLDNVIYYDLTDEEWRSVKITRNGWEIEAETPIIFTRYRQLPQVEPDANYGDITLDHLIRLTNVRDPVHQLLVKVYIVSLFVPDMGHPILNVFGEKGSAKSMLFNLIKLLVDPAKPSLLTLHKDRNEFIQQLAHNWLAYYDNARHVPDWLSDEACRATTGGGHSKRKLYSDDDDIIYDYKRCLGFNGINITLTSEDALDRSIMVDLVRISRKDRKLEAEVLAEFEEIRPKLLGYIFDTLSKAMAIHEQGLQLEDLPRMADFAVWGEAIARAMGYKPLEFINAYYDNIGKQNIEAVSAHPFGQSIAKWVQGWGDQRSEWEGSPQELLDILEPIAIEQKLVDTKIVRDGETANTVITDKNWPKIPNYVSRRLNQIRSNLLEGLGIQVDIERITTGSAKGRATVKVRKVSPLSSPSSPKAESDTLDDLMSGDSGDREDTFPCKEAPQQQEDVQNHTQETTAISVSAGPPQHHKQRLFMEIFRALEKETGDTVNHDRLKRELVSSGKFDAGEAHQIIQDNLASNAIYETLPMEYKEAGP